MGGTLIYESLLSTSPTVKQNKFKNFDNRVTVVSKAELKLLPIKVMRCESSQKLTDMS